LKKHLEILQKCPLFVGIDTDNLLKMLHCLGASVACFDKKYTIFAEGAPAKKLGIVLSGSAQLELLDYYGNRSIIAKIEPSHMFAEAFACAEVGALPLSVVANEPSEVMLIDCAHILHTCDNHCSFHRQMIFNLMKDLSHKTIAYHQKMEILSKRTTREKLLAYLLFESKRTGKEGFDIPFNRQELSDYLQVERSGLSVEIGKLQKEGVLMADRKHFTLLQ